MTQETVPWKVGRNSLLYKLWQFSHLLSDTGRDSPAKTTVCRCIPRSLVLTPIVGMVCVIGCVLLFIAELLIWGWDFFMSATVPILEKDASIPFLRYNPFRFHSKKVRWCEIRIWKLPLRPWLPALIIAYVLFPELTIAMGVAVLSVLLACCIFFLALVLLSVGPYSLFLVLTNKPVLAFLKSAWTSVSTSLRADATTGKALWKLARENFCVPIHFEDPEL